MKIAFRTLRGDLYFVGKEFISPLVRSGKHVIAYRTLETGERIWNLDCNRMFGNGSHLGLEVVGNLHLRV